MPDISRLLSHHARYRGNYPAFDFDGKSWNFLEFDSYVNRLANALLNSGLTKGDRFATVLPNSAELMAAYWAAAVSGLVIVPCSNLLQKTGLATLLNDSGARLIIIGKEQLGAIEEIIDGLDHVDSNRIVVTTDEKLAGYVSYSDFVCRCDSHAPDIEVHPGDVYNIMYSSGTTGLPKGIVHTHQIRSMYCALFANAWRMTPESVVLHAGAIVFNGAMLDLMPWMYLGCRYILHTSFNAEAVIADVEKFGVTHLVMVPAQIIAILNSPSFDPARLSSLEMLHNVGAPLHLNYKKIINDKLPDRFYELYGVTEGFMTILDKTEAVRKEGSVGKPAAFNEVRIMDEDGNSCRSGEIGEICGRGPMVMPGYHNRPDLTAQAFHGAWLRSGDLGYLDEDGYLFLVDRSKDMIISGGVNVYPKDIEEIVIRHPAVEEVAVFGIEDQKWGEVPVAAITTNQPVISSEMVEWVNQRVDAKFQRISNVLVLDEFPRNVAGKILKRELRNNYKHASVETNI